jgi:hypothetical protein
LELEQETRQAVVKQFIITKQYLIDALIENIEKALPRIPVKIGKVGEEREVYLYRGEVGCRPMVVVMPFEGGAAPP